MSKPACPNCLLTLPDEITASPAAKDLQCELCGAALHWENGAVRDRAAGASAPKPSPTPKPAPSPASAPKPAPAARPSPAPAPRAPSLSPKPAPPPSLAPKPVPPATPRPSPPSPKPAAPPPRPTLIAAPAPVPEAKGPMVDPTNWFTDGITSVGEEDAPPGARGKLSEPEPLAPAPDGPPRAQQRLKSDPNLTPLTPEAAVATPPPRAASRTPAMAAPVVEQPTPVVEMPAAIVEQARPPTEKPTPVVEVSTDVRRAASGAAVDAEPSATSLPSIDAVPMRTRRPLLLALGIVPVLALFGLLILRGRKPPTEPATPSAPAAATKASAPPAAPPAPVPAAAPPDPVEPATPSPAVAAGPARKSRTLGGKKVVLEYDPKPASPTPIAPTAPTPKGEDPAVIEKARAAYHRGNNRLFGGDISGAETAYKETLAIYPGYVSGYRGLGLAYERAGKHKEALDAFRVYLRTVPTANDAELIRQRVARLEKKR